MVQLECLRVIHPWSHSFLGLTGCPFSACRKREMLHVACKLSGNLLLKNRFRGLQMVRFECTRVIHLLLSFTLGIHYGVLFALHGGKWYAA